MKKFLNKKNIFILSFLILGTLAFKYDSGISEKTLQTSAVYAETLGIQKGEKGVKGKITSAAKKCSSDAYGNMDGYIDTDNLGRIYLNTASWNRENPTNTVTTVWFVDYDRQARVWSGRGWAAGSDKSVGWVDFSFDQLNKIVQFESPAADPAGWGNWDGQVNLSSVAYSTTNGGFTGTGSDSHGDTGGILDPTEDDKIGSGKWNFDNVEFLNADLLCPQRVNLFLNGTPRLERENCPIKPNRININWTTENVRDCRSVSGVLWDDNPKAIEYIGSGEHPNGRVDDENAPVSFTLRCIGEYSNTPVYGFAQVTCGEHDLGGSTDSTGITSPIYKEA